MPDSPLAPFVELVRDIEPFNCKGPQTEVDVALAETRLGVRFPVSYREFLLTFGRGVWVAQEFFGVSGAEVTAAAPDVVWMTRDARQSWGLPNSYVVVGFTGGVEYYVIDTEAGGAGSPEPPVQVWVPGGNRGGDKLEVVAPNFGAHAFDLVSSMIRLNGRPT